jgi:hypothetical protein
VWRDIAGYITEYQMAAPYVKDDLPGTQLFDVPFDPETNGKAEWKAWKGSGASPWICDLAPQGNDRCGYLRAQLWAPKAQDAMLLVAADDGVKVWLNGKLVHQKNKVQSYNDPADQVKVALVEGWNPILLKIVQRDGGWGVITRIVAADGNKLEGLKTKAE